MGDFPTNRDLFRVARDEILIKAARLSSEAVEREGSDANVLIAGAVAAAEEVVGQLIRVTAGLFLDSAEGQPLDRLVFDRYGLVRKQAAPSIGFVEFTTIAANPTAFNIPTSTQLQTFTGLKFQVMAATVFPQGSVGLIQVPVRSLLAGSEEQAQASTIVGIVSAITNSPVDLRVTNAAATAGAADAETDDSLRDRARRFFSTVRRGTIDALVTGALAVPGVVTAQVVEKLDIFGRPAGLVQLIISDQFTDALVELGQNPPAYQAQAQALAATVFAALSDVRAAGISIEVIVAQVILIAVQLQLTFTAGADTASVATQARAAIVEYVNGLAPTAPFVRADAADRLASVTGLIITGNEIAVPAGDVVPTILQVLRTSLGLVTA